MGITPSTGSTAGFSSWVVVAAGAGAAASLTLPSPEGEGETSLLKQLHTNSISGVFVSDILILTL